jgi:GntR family transcriptional repressor for pyruvate dehydrogenase complex
MDNLSQIIKQSLEYTLRQNTRNIERYRRVLQEHKEIYECITKRDSQGAVEAMRKHLENVRQKLLALED